jgi:N-formylglutamate amidohydrolase
MDRVPELMAARAASDSGPTSDLGVEAPFVLIEPLHRTSAAVFASPHSGRHYPKAMLALARVGLSALRRSEDAYAGAAAHGAPVLMATVARAFVDLNRDPAELDGDMFHEPPARLAPASPRVQAGLGAIPKVTGDGLAIYWRRLPFAEAERRLAQVYEPYHQAVRGLLDAAFAQFGCAILVDCHSMPATARGPNSPDIVLGDRFGASCHPAIVGLVEATLKRQGYRVARNAPFAGGYTTQIYGRPYRRIHALQIEINRGLYLDEYSLERTAGFTRVRADMAKLAETLNAAELHVSLA